MWIFEKGSIPIFATAIHNGHFVRKELLNIMKISEIDRLREEDPYTAEFTTISDNRMVNYLSRFEVDFNRPKELAVYLTKEQAWGLDLWKIPPSDEMIKKSLEKYEIFYKQLDEFLKDRIKKFKYLVVYDIHSYNYKRGSTTAPQEENPDINVGTKTLKNRDKFENIINIFIENMKKDFFGKTLDVRENVKFGGGHFPRWIHEKYPENIVVLSIEFKKIFMDEETGEFYPEKLSRLKDILKSTVKPVLKELEKL